MEVCTNACEQQGDNNGVIAQAIKQTLDSHYPTYNGPSTWNVVVGERYSFEIVYQLGHLMYMYFPTTRSNLAICVWKC